MSDSAAGNNPANPNAGKTRNDPQIKIAGRWVPAHTAWGYMETASRFVDSIERFNDRFPDLSTKNSREVVPLVRERLRNIALRMPEKPDAPLDPGRILTELLAEVSPEEAIAELQKRTGRTVDLQELISLTGEDAYVKALKREATEFRKYSIHPEQTAQIWNEMGRPPPSGGIWSERRIQELIA